MIIKKRIRRRCLGRVVENDDSLQYISIFLGISFPIKFELQHIFLSLLGRPETFKVEHYIVWKSKQDLRHKR